jgi:hypothetical protein
MRMMRCVQAMARLGKLSSLQRGSQCFPSAPQMLAEGGRYILNHVNLGYFEGGWHRQLKEKLQSKKALSVRVICLSSGPCERRVICWFPTVAQFLTLSQTL